MAKRDGERTSQFTLKIFVFLLILIITPIFFTQTSAVAAPTVVDQAVTLNGSSQYATVAEGTTFINRNDFTVESWILPTSTCSATCYFLSHDGDYVLGIANGKFSVTQYYNGVNTYVNVTTSVVAIQNQWQHVAYSKSGASLKLYLNGELVWSYTIAGTPTISTYSNFALKIGWHYGSSFFTGKIDEYRLYASALTQVEVKDSMVSWGQASATGLVAYYDFNSPSGSTVPNQALGTSGSPLLSLASTPTFTNIATSSVSGIYTSLSFSRTYITSNGGWNVPGALRNVDLLIVGGGGGGGGGYDNGGGGGGGAGFVREILNTDLQYSETISVVVGTGGVAQWFDRTSSSPYEASGLLGGNSIAGFTGTTLLARGGGGGDSSRVSISSGARANISTPSSGGSGGGSSSRGGGGGGNSGDGAAVGTGTGGAGQSSSLTGSAITYGVGGTGGPKSTASEGTNGGANSGNGGNGGGAVSNSAYRGGFGGTGIIVIRYVTDTPPIISGPSSTTTGASSISVAENSATVFTFTASETATWSISGTDASDFSIGSSTGILIFSSPPNFELPADSNLDNVYIVIISALDSSGYSNTQTLTVTVTNVDENSVLSSLSLSGPATKGLTVTISISSNFPGKVTFTVNGKRITACISKSMTGTSPTYTANCPWKPAVGGTSTVGARFIPTDQNNSAVSAQTVTLNVLRRTGTR